MDFGAGRGHPSHRLGKQLVRTGMPRKPGASDTHPKASHPMADAIQRPGCPGQHVQKERHFVHRARHRSRAVLAGADGDDALGRDGFQRLV